jgi:hypothetical protein
VSSDTIDAVAVYLPIRAESEANKREHWAVRKKRKDAQQLTVREKMNGLKPTLRRLGDRYHVTLTRLGKRKMDKDNLAGSFKHVQDEVARILGVDDGDEARVTWDYQQLVCKVYEVLIEVRAQEV